MDVIESIGNRVDDALSITPVKYAVIGCAIVGALVIATKAKDMVM